MDYMDTEMNHRPNMRETNYQQVPDETNREGVVSIAVWFGLILLQAIPVVNFWDILIESIG
ncbi:hypothetical protein GLW08_04325 [Pontibacillus yanchengensis]|uniref:Uncharacterized protein n=2 Tax=Pontibacillus yanchengensis TaxID=462910 RepID=A0ACC7VD82_9BACI|nr:hypothetical protein [Pontibacillus yanchengensis]MYL35073.1 hypothetical protein [Pontibacillus yanchengensis]MYL52560.1 hypothetical protein [Pontibacillus yanchengensis]